jgi:hypothetical protein
VEGFGVVEYVSKLEIEYDGLLVVGDGVVVEGMVVIIHQ